MKQTLLLTCFFFVFSCKVRQPATEHQESGIMNDGKIFTAFFQQHAAEYKALCQQSYHLARVNLDQALQQSPTKPAIIFDIDETILDNSRYAVKRAMEKKEYSLESWKEWTALAAADTLVGALEFFRYAASRGVEIFYITNRDESERSGTVQNLKKFGFPVQDDAHVIFRSGVSSKEERRKKVMQDYQVLLLIGDNLGDFSADFDKKPINERLQNTMNSSSRFGTRFIVLPNPFYGDWEGSAFQYKQLSVQQKDSVIRKMVMGY